jgi:hypothetical protein
MLIHGAALGGRHIMPRCAKCTDRSYLARGQRNTYWALSVLVVAFVASYPSPLSDGYLAGLSREWAAIVRIEIWGFAYLIALPVFTFTGRLTPLARDTPPIALISGRAFALEWLFWAFILWWIYVLYTGLKTVS